MTQISSSSFSQFITFARGKNGDVYGVTGKERGFRWDTATATVEQLGISAPTSAPSVSEYSGDKLYYLAGIDVKDPGAGYRSDPQIHIGGGSATTLSVTGTASTDEISCASHGLSDGQTVEFLSLSGGAGLVKHRTYYVISAGSSTFQVALTPGGSAVNFTTNITAGSIKPGVSVPGAAKARVQNGRVVGVQLLRYGVGYTSPPSITCDAPDSNAPTGSGASFSAVVSTVTNGGVTYKTVTSVTVLNPGSGYYGRPRLVFSGGGAPTGGGAAAEAVIDANGGISGVTVIQGGEYLSAPSVAVASDWAMIPRAAGLTPVLRAGMFGKYWCAVRYVDDTTAARGGPIPSSISELADIEFSQRSAGIVWSVDNSNAEARVHKIEFWRTTADEVTVLYKVGEVLKSAAGSTYTFTDSLSDAELANPERDGFEAMPIVLPNGQANARRFNPPPRNKAVIAIFQDRAWYGVDVPGRTFTGGTDATAAAPNTLYFSEADEPESVPEFNELILQENVKGQDRITALMPFGGGMVVFQTRHAYRLTFVAQPLIDANIMLICQRGCLNQRCWDAYDGVAYVADSMGMYMLDGVNAVPLSDSVDTYWTDGIIDFSNSQEFFVRVDPATRIARFVFLTSLAYGAEQLALCFHPITKAWWVEKYAQSFWAMECLASGGRQTLVAGGAYGRFYKFDSGHVDVDASQSPVNIACQYRSGFFPFVNEPSRSVRVLYKPTAADCNLALALHYNGSSSARAAAVRTDRGTGFTTDANQNATLNLKLSRSALGDATGYAVASYVGRMEDKSAGGDRHLGIALSLTRPSSEGATIYGAGIEGIGQ